MLPALRRDFSYTGYFLNNPPTEKSNSWTGKRAILKSSGFGFVILFTGRLDAELKKQDPAALGRADAAQAIAAAEHEGFPSGAIIFLDQEEGGRLLPEQSTYLFSWVQAIRGSHYRPGVYCGGIKVGQGSDAVSTAGDIASHDAKLPLWVANDQCPPSPGCVLKKSGTPVESGISQATVWQYAQSPRRPFAKGCGTGYAADAQCYAPSSPHSAASYVDLDVSSSADPSHGR
jgi:Domain of unknown function (DUF1906)